MSGGALNVCQGFALSCFVKVFKEAVIVGRGSGFVDLWHRPKETVASHGDGVCASEGRSTGQNVIDWALMLFAGTAEGFQIVFLTCSP